MQRNKPYDIREVDSMEAVQHLKEDPGFVSKIPRVSGVLLVWENPSVEYV